MVPFLERQRYGRTRRYLAKYYEVRVDIQVSGNNILRTHGSRRPIAVENELSFSEF